MKILPFIFLLTLIVVACNTNTSEDKQSLTSEEAAVIANKTITFAVEGMSCSGCENTIMEAVGGIKGVSDVAASHMEGSATVNFDSTMTDIKAISAAITEAGYTVAGEKPSTSAPPSGN